jgi:predicted Zn-dependent peptidase
MRSGWPTRVEHGGYAGDDWSGSAVEPGKHPGRRSRVVDTLRAPGFRRSDFERIIKRRIEGIKQTKGSPASVASRVSGVVLYGPDHPFGTVITERSLAAITLDDCKAFARTWLVPHNARLFVVGDGGPGARVLRLAGLAGWAGAGPALRAPAPRTMPGRVFS